VRIRIFLSFDPDHDADLPERFVGQAERPGSAFELTGGSQGHTMTEAWSSTSRTRIQAADQVVVICGEHTNSSPRVSAELRIAQEEEKPYLLLWGRRERMCTKPEGARPSDAMYSWTPEILEGQLREVLRNAASLQTAESIKRPAR